ncbi:MAG: DUF4276 family protein [Candidatus Binatia bacterium]
MMTQRHKFRIIPVVEGHGEEYAVPIMLNNWFKHRRFFNFTTPDLAVRAHQASLLCEYDSQRERGIEHYLNLAMCGRPDAILVMFDADDECIARQDKQPYQPLGPELLQRARNHLPHIPISVVVANREFEAWYLAAYRRFKGRGHFHRDTKFTPGFDVETPRDCKGHVSTSMGRKYSETADQKVLTEHLGFGSYISRYSPSFKKLLKDLDWLAQQARRIRRNRMNAAQ